MRVTHLESQANWILEVRMFDDGVGYRYRVPGQGIRSVSGEASSWALPEDNGGVISEVTVSGQRASSERVAEALERVSAAGIADGRYRADLTVAPPP